MYQDSLRNNINNRIRLYTEMFMSADITEVFPWYTDSFIKEMNSRDKPCSVDVQELLVSGTAKVIAVCEFRKYIRLLHAEPRFRYVPETNPLIFKFVIGSQLSAYKPSLNRQSDYTVRKEMSVDDTIQTYLDLYNSRHREKMSRTKLNTKIGGDKDLLFDITHYRKDSKGNIAYRKKLDGHTAALICLALKLSPEEAADFYANCDALYDLESYNITATTLLYYIDHNHYDIVDFKIDLVRCFEELQGNVPPEMNLPGSLF